MTASDHISNQFITVFRGLSNVEPDAVNYEKLGMHWTTSPGVANTFTEGRGSIVEAKVDKSHLMTPDHPDWKEFQIRHSVFGPNSKEREQTVIPGSPISVKKVHHVYDEDSEPLTFKPNEDYDELSKRIPKKATS